MDTFADSDFTWEKFEDAYNNELANDLGNLVQRLATLAKKNEISIGKVEVKLPEEYCALMDDFEFSKAFDDVWGRVQAINRQIDEDKPWSLAKNGEIEKLHSSMKSLITELLTVAKMLEPFIPNTAEKVEAIFTDPIEPPETPLFPKSK